VVAPVLGKPRGLPRLQALCDAWLRYAESGTFEGGCFFTNAALELDDIEDTPAREAVRAQFGAFLDLIEKCARDAVQAGHFRRDLDVRQFALALHGIKTGALVWKALGRLKNPFAVAREAMRDLIEGARA
jgi:AcrR family transcriptional regulator